MAEDTPLAIACGAVSAISLSIQLACLFAQSHFPPPLRQVRVFRDRSLSFVVVNLVQFAITLIVLGLLASLVSDHAPGSSLPAAIIYSIFPSIASMLTLISFSFAQISVTFRRRGHIWSLNIFNIILSAFAVLVLPIKLGNQQCVYTAGMSTNPILGSYAPDDRPSACQRTQVAILFYSLLLISYIVTLAMAMDSVLEGDRRGGTNMPWSSSNPCEELVRQPPQAAGVGGGSSTILTPRSFSNSYSNAAQTDSSINGFTQHYQNAKVVNFISSEGQPVTQYYDDSQVLNMAADNGTTSMALQGMMSSRLTQ